MRFLSSLASCSRVGVSIPDCAASSLEKLFVGLAAVAPHDRAQRRVGLQRGGIDRNRAAFQQTLLGEQLQHPGERLAVRFDVDQAAVREIVE